MVATVGRITAGQIDMPLRNQPAWVAVLIAFQSRLSLARIFAWRSRKTDRRHVYKMPIPVALALYQYLRDNESITNAQQDFLGRLDKAMVDHHVPSTELLAQRAALTNLLYAATA